MDIDKNIQTNLLPINISANFEFFCRYAVVGSKNNHAVQRTGRSQNPRK